MYRGRSIQGHSHGDPCPNVAEPRSILVGDPKQLPPHIESDNNENGESPFSVEARESLFPSFYRVPSENVEELVEQRRMCSTIGSLVSQVLLTESSSTLGKMMNAIP